MKKTLAPLMTSNSERWFTPPDLLAEVSAFFGGTYYDPCPARVEGEQIENGLWAAWRGRVYVNPPYGRHVIDRWVAKAMGEPVDEIVLLLPARPGSRWFGPLFDLTVLFITPGRLHFSGAKNGATFDSVLVYRGPRAEAFMEAFWQWGRMMRACDQQVRAAAQPRTLWTPATHE